MFAQALPFVHSPHFVDLLKNPSRFQPVQCLSLVYMSAGLPDYVTPKEVVETYRQVLTSKIAEVTPVWLFWVKFSDRDMLQVSCDGRCRCLVSGSCEGQSPASAS